MVAVSLRGRPLNDASIVLGIALFGLACTTPTRENADTSSVEAESSSPESASTGQHSGSSLTTATTSSASVDSGVSVTEIETQSSALSSDPSQTEHSSTTASSETSSATQTTAETSVSTDSSSWTQSSTISSASSTNSHPEDFFYCAPGLDCERSKTYCRRWNRAPVHYECVIIPNECLIEHACTCLVKLQDHPDWWDCAGDLSEGHELDELVEETGG